jgi:hypothetical protein
VRTGFGLSGLPQYGLAYGARWKQFSFLTQALGLFGETFLERLCLLETATHGAAPFPFEEAGAQPAISSPMDTTCRAVMQRQ